MSVKNNFILIDHPLVKRDIAVLRKVETNCKQFRDAVNRISNILAVEISKEFELLLNGFKKFLQLSRKFRYLNHPRISQVS